MLNQLLAMDRPIVFFDLETTGTMINRDRIVEISVVKVEQDGSTRTTTRRINPEMPIPPSATAIHGIHDADVADAPTFSLIAANLAKYLEGADLAGYNLLKFDIPMLQEEFKRCGVPFSLEGRRVFDVFNIFRKLFPRNLSAAYRFFCGKELEGAHGAQADTLATLEVLEAQLEKYPEVPRDPDALAKYSDDTDPDAVDKTRRFKWLDGEVIVNFGKNAGRKLKEISEKDPGFLRWIIRSDFPDDVKSIASEALLGRFPERKDPAP